MKAFRSSSICSAVRGNVAIGLMGLIVSVKQGFRGSLSTSTKSEMGKGRVLRLMGEVDVLPSDITKGGCTNGATGLWLSGAGLVSMIWDSLSDITIYNISGVGSR